MRVFLDANVVFSAAWSPQSAATLLLDLAGAGYCTPLISELALREARYNLEMKRSEALDRFRAIGALLEIVPEPGPPELQLAANAGLPDKDIPILAAAIAARAECLVTGDRRDFGHLFGTRVSGVLVQTLPKTITTILDRADPG